MCYPSNSLLLEFIGSSCWQHTNDFLCENCSFCKHASETFSPLGLPAADPSLRTILLTFSPNVSCEVCCHCSGPVNSLYFSNINFVDRFSSLCVVMTTGSRKSASRVCSELSTSALAESSEHTTRKLMWIKTFALSVFQTTSIIQFYVPISRSEQWMQSGASAITIIVLLTGTYRTSALLSLVVGNIPDYSVFEHAGDDGVRLSVRHVVVLQQTKRPTMMIRFSPNGNLLTLNSSKTEFLIIFPKRQLSKMDNSLL